MFCKSIKTLTVSSLSSGMKMAFSFPLRRTRTTLVSVTPYPTTYHAAYLCLPAALWVQNSVAEFNEHKELYIQPPANLPGSVQGGTNDSTGARLVDTMASHQSARRRRQPPTSKRTRLDCKLDSNDGSLVAYEMTTHLLFPFVFTFASIADV